LLARAAGPDAIPGLRPRRLFGCSDAEGAALDEDGQTEAKIPMKPRY